MNEPQTQPPQPAAGQDAGQAASVDLYVMGAGVSFPQHITIQTLRILQACKQICSNLPQSDLDLLPDDLRSKSMSFWPLYQENRDRDRNYNDVAEAVLAATARERPVAWLTPGHPVIFDSVTQMLLTTAPQRGFKITVIAAISCIDTILAQLGYDPADGLAIYDATSLVMRDLPPVTWTASLLFQPSAFGSMHTHYSTRWTPDLSPLRDHLLKFYPAEHPCAFVRSGSPQSGPDQVSWCAIGDMTSASFDIIAGTTMFVPAAKQE
jgi:hypothetical protein